MIEPYEYQVEGAEFLAPKKRAYLADDCGIGKTVQATVAAGMVNAQRTVCICPASAIPNWVYHWGECGGPGELLTESYTKLAMVPDMFDGVRPDLVILDEAHYVKSRTAQRTLAALTLARKAPQAWLLSATPTPNHLGELWAPMRALWPGVPRQLGIKNSFHWRNKFTSWSRDRYGRLRTHGSKNGELLQPFLDRLMLRRGEDDIGHQLPPLRVDVFRLAKDDGFAAALKESGVDADKLMRRIEREEATEDGSTSRLRRLVGEYKAPRIAAIVAEELRENQYPKIVIMAHHKSVIATFAAALWEFGVITLTGDHTRAQKAKAEQSFRTGIDRVFIGQATAAGIALNLQAAPEMILAEPSWTPDDNWQAIKRIHRVDSKYPCRARLFAVEGTLDEAIMTTTARKTRTKAEARL